jgi:hypothetical protein
MVSLACLLLVTVGSASSAAAKRDIVFHLYGSRAAGWGFTSTSLTSPGPLMEVWVGDNVTLNLTSVDGITHRWFLDYNNNSAADVGEPASPNFPGLQNPVLWNFTVSNRTGTFPYRSDRGPGNPRADLVKMSGNITITPAGSSGFLASGLVIAGVVILAIAVVAILVFFSRRSRSLPPPPPPEG